MEDNKTVSIKEYIDVKGISIKEYVDKRIDAIDIRIDALERNSDVVARNLEKSTSIAASQMEKRLEGMNEFRNQLKDQTASFMTRVEYDNSHKRVEEDIRGLRESRAELAGKASQTSVNIALAIAIIGIIIGAIGLVHSLNEKPNATATQQQSFHPPR